MSAPELIRRVVRTLGSGQSHVVDSPAGAFDRYTWIGSPEFTAVALPAATACGAALRSSRGVAVCMRAGTKVSCSRCRRLTGIEVAPEHNADMPESGQCPDPTREGQ